jgi:hypothetical protein
VIAFAGIRSRIAAEGAIVSEGRVAGVSATLTSAQGGASQRSSHGRCLTAGRIHSSRNSRCRREELARMRIVTSRAATPSISALREPGRRETPASCAIAEPRRCGTRQSLPGSAGELSAAPHAELVDAHGLLASLVWHRVRPPNPSGADTGPGRPSRSDLESLGKPRSVRPVTPAQTASVDQSPASIEALFSHLARRRLRSLAAKEKQA